MKFALGTHGLSKPGLSRFSLVTLGVGAAAATALATVLAVPALRPAAADHALSLVAGTCTTPASTVKYTITKVKRSNRSTTVLGAWVVGPGTATYKGVHTSTQKGSVTGTTPASWTRLVSAVSTKADAPVVRTWTYSTASSFKAALPVPAKKTGRLVLKHTDITFAYQQYRWVKSSCSWVKKGKGTGRLPLKSPAETYFILQTKAS